MVRGRMPMSPRVLHITTTDVSLHYLLGGQLEGLSNRGYEVHAASAPGAYREQIEARGATFHPLSSSTRSWAPTADLSAAVELRRLLRDLRPDILHTHNPKPGIYGRIVGGLDRSVKVVNTVHGLYAQPTDPLRRRALVYGVERLAAAFSDHELYQNSEDLGLMRRFRFPADKQSLLGNGIDLERFRPVDTAGDRRELRRRLGLPADALIFGSVGRLVGEKGVRELLEAFSSADLPLSSHLAIVGAPDGSREDGLASEEIEAAEASPSVTFHGHRENVEEFYRSFDVLVSASYREGFPRSVMEGCASGCAVLATDIRGTRDAVEGLEAAVLVSPRSVEELRSGMERLAASPADLPQLQERALAHARRAFDEQRLAEVIDGVYRSVLGSPEDSLRNVSRPGQRTL